MHRRCIWMLSIAFTVLLSNPSFADYKSANRVTPLNKTTDFLATIGKTPQDKKEILRERRDQRRDIRLKEEARRKRVQTRRKMKLQQQNIMRKINAE